MMQAGMGFVAGAGGGMIWAGATHGGTLFVVLK